MRRRALGETPLEGRELLARVKKVFPGRWARPRGLPEAVMAKVALVELPLKPKVSVYISPNTNGYDVQVIAPDLDSESMAIGRLPSIDRTVGYTAMSKILERAARDYQRQVLRRNLMAGAFWDDMAKALGIT